MMQNGHMPMMGMPMDTAVMEPPTAPLDAPLFPSYSREDILEMVDTHERDTQPLRTRMENDYDLYRLKSHINTDNVSGEALPNYAVYTSNMPRVFADKVISWQTLAELLLRVPHVEAGSHEEETDNAKERFAIGCMRAADERMRRQRQPSLRGQLASFVTIRGGYIGGRALLVNRPDGRTFADITAWDPLHIHWGIGQDDLEWSCYKIKKTWSQIKREYGVDLRGGKSTSSDAEKSGIWTYDFYDGWMNTVIADGQVVKPPTPHGSPRVPTYLTLVGAMPVLQSQTASNLIADVGESVYSAVREVYKKNNSIMSIMLEIVERARRQTVIAESRDGKKTLPEDPFKEQTSISTVTGERIYTLELQKMAAETAGYMVAVAGEIQRATLPYSSYGETPFQLSGFAITQLRQATETVLSSRIQALEDCYLQIANLLYDQFMTGSFSALRLAGRDSNRAYFNETLTPQMMQGTCDYSVKIVSQLPQDNAAKWSQAQIAKETGLLSDVDILDYVLELQDSQQTIDKKRAEMAEGGLPEAVLYTMMMAAANRGNAIMANLYLAEYQRLMDQKLGIMPPDQPANGKNQPAAKGGGQRPEVLPDAATGAAPQPETSNDGPSRIAPGTPRPGAQGQKA